MTRLIQRLTDVAERFDAIVLDQWGVLHDGTAPYPGAVEAVDMLAKAGVRLGVLSNSGKRASINADRISDIGFNAEAFEVVMTSGEALWRDIENGTVTSRRLFPIERAPGDANVFLHGLDARLVETVHEADAVLLMGVPDDSPHEAFAEYLDEARGRNVPVICTNPDRASPRADGQTVASPGALAHAHAAAGGEVLFYGKPYLPIFRAMEAALDVAADRIVMVGDSLEHDIAGAAQARWASVFVRGGLHASAFGDDNLVATLGSLAQQEGAPMPDYTLNYIGGQIA